MEKKAVIEVVGGLGNQFFIYCTALHLEKIGYDVKLDTEYYSWWPRRKRHARSFDLDKYNIKFKKASEREVRELIFRTKNRLINCLLKRKKYFSKKAVWLGDERNLENLPDRVYVIGFEINYKFIENNKNEILTHLSLKRKFKKNIKSLLQKIAQRDTVSVNVRRGDLLEFKDANILGIDYYKKAVSIIRRKIRDPKFFIFSDDISWCKKNFDWLENKEFVEGHPVYEDLELMKSCNHNILANSSLSWWAGYLNPHQDKIVIAPIKFYHRERHKGRSKAGYPREWIWIK